MKKVSCSSSGATSREGRARRTSATPTIAACSAPAEIFPTRSPTMLIISTAESKYLQVFKNEELQARLLRSVNVVNDPRVGSATFGQPICRSVLDGTDPSCSPFNYFGTPSADAVAYANVYGVDPGETSEQIANANITGKLGTLGIATPWASEGLGFNAGWEYRKEQLSLDPDEEFQQGDLTGQGAPTLPNHGGFHVNELFAEAQIPIVSHEFIEDLSFGAGYRKSWYGTTRGTEIFDRHLQALGRVRPGFGHSLPRFLQPGGASAQHPGIVHHPARRSRRVERSLRGQGDLGDRLWLHRPAEARRDHQPDRLHHSAQPVVPV